METLQNIIHIHIYMFLKGFDGKKILKWSDGRNGVDKIVKNCLSEVKIA